MLEEADLSGAALSRARLNGAKAARARLPQADLRFADGLTQVGFSAHLGLHEDETSARCTWRSSAMRQAIAAAKALLRLVVPGRKGSSIKLDSDEVRNLPEDVSSNLNGLLKRLVRNQQARYDVGLVTTKDLLDYHDKLTQVRAAEVQAVTTYNSDLAEMRRVEGTLLSARNVLIERATPEATPWRVRF